MRIAMVSEHASPLTPPGGVDAGGQNVYVGSLSRALAARGHQVTVYTRKDDETLPQQVRLCAGVDVVHVPAGPARPLAKDELLCWMPDFGDWLAASWRPGTDPRTACAPPPDVVHAHFWMSGLAAQRAVRSLRCRIPVVQTFHALGSVKRRYQGEDDTSPPRRVAAERDLAVGVDQVIATCSDEVGELLDLTGGESLSQDVRVVPCGVDLERFTPDGPGRLPAGVHGWPDSAPPYFRLLHVGRLVERKGVDTLIQALSRLPDCRLIVAGGPAAGALDTDPEALRLRELAGAAGVGDRVRLIGRVDQQDLPGLLRWADAVLATPWYEPFGIVPLEAMACGRPLVASAVGGLLDTVLPGVTGVLVPPRDPDALAAAVHDLLADPVVKQAVGRAARGRAEELYGWATVAEQIETAYRGVVGALDLLTPRRDGVLELLTADAL